MIVSTHPRPNPLLMVIVNEILPCWSDSQAQRWIMIAPKGTSNLDVGAQIGKMEGSISFNSEGVITDLPMASYISNPFNLFHD